MLLSGRDFIVPSSNIRDYIHHYNRSVASASGTPSLPQQAADEMQAKRAADSQADSRLHVNPNREIGVWYYEDFKHADVLFSPKVLKRVTDFMTAL